MTFALFLKILGEMSYYISAASFIAGTCGFETGERFPVFLIPLFLLAFTGASALFISRAGRPSLRFLPFGLLASVYFLLPDIFSVAVFLPPAAYVIYLAASGYEPKYAQSVQIFRTLCPLLPVPVLVIILFGRTEQFIRYSLPYLLLFLLTEVQLLRTLRHDESVVSGVRYQLFNGASLILTAGAAALLSSPAARAAAASALGFLYRNLLMPVFMLLVLIVTGICWLSVKLISLIFPSPQADQALNELAQGLGVQDLIPEAAEAAGAPLWLSLTFRILGALIIAFFIFLLLRRFFLLITGRSRVGTAPSGETVRSRLSDRTSGPAPLKRLGLTTPEEKVRYYYRELIRFSVSAGGIFSPCHTTEDIESMELGMIPEASREIRSLHLLYRPARYGGEISPASADEAKRLYKEIKRLYRLRQQEK